MVQSTTKHCIMCGVEYPLTNEYFAPIQKGRYFNSYCRLCHSKINVDNKRRIIARDPKAFSEQRKRQPSRSKERTAQDNKARYWKYRDKELARIKANRRRFADRRKEYQKVYRQTHREQRKLWARNHYKDNPTVRLKNHVHSRNRKMRMKMVEGTHTATDIKRLYEDQDGRCLYCGIGLLESEVTVDHVVPITRGGSNWSDNLVVCCKSCNSSKNNRTIPEWEKARGWKKCL